jgi:hypothetical protein
VPPTGPRRGRPAPQRRGREQSPFDERILAEIGLAAAIAPARAWRVFARLHVRLAATLAVSAVRPALGAAAVHGLGLVVTRMARALGVIPMPLARPLSRGREPLTKRGLAMETLARSAWK